ncbi:uncharacterized protein HD556DRAFT_1449981 [Suillus plorans]|uniref:CxC5 like cysteine cluster associated with KDZ domain-containing protein n=1 Tax=Suillus plorans TaxID=116603 RepID=A0A9P7ABT6_9AGAM|nr:uncharacterized protein HD556DRAFT_1449981 [Suillus plorans]KAG1786126.1 hypothetical protein HD556DRAFT_1449981 [Suillus plorans]
MDVRTPFPALDHPELQDLSYIAITRFLRCASMLKDDILLPQPHSIPVTTAPDVLPPGITDFFSRSFNISCDAVDVLWGAVKHIAWTLPADGEEHEVIETMFQHHGQDQGISAYVLYPPMKTCVNPDCIAVQCATPLKKDEPRRVVIFTQAFGVRCAWSVHLKCRSCNVNYHHNYAVHGASRQYYSGVPKYIQVGEHQFVERELAMHWIDLMRIPVSATDCARLYNEAQARRKNVTCEWQFNTTEEVWDAFTVLALLDDHQLRNTSLCVPHDNSQSARNERIITEGQDELPHACYGCMRLFSMPDGTTHYTEVVVTDGITVGRPCCAVPHCKNALASTHNRFCSANPSHRQLETICAVDGCDQPVIRHGQGDKLRKTCSNPLHMNMEDAKAVLSWSGKSKTQRMKTAKLNDALAASSHDHPEDDLPVEDFDEWYEHDESTGNVRLKQASAALSMGVVNPSLTQNESRHILKVCPSKDDVPKLKLFVRPCGIISGRGTMYHHEAVSNVLILFEKTFSLPRARKPQHLIYNSNCNALREVESRKMKFFEGIGMCVDAFHHTTKHKASDQFCQERCSMKAYPKLLNEDGKYYFNSSIAEQTNMWFGGFHNMCHEMTPVKYDFFLDEVILRHNRATVINLHRQGKQPHHPHLST